MTFGIITNPIRYNINTHLNKVIEWCITHQTELILSKLLKKWVDETHRQNSLLNFYEDEKHIVKDADAIISIGGDGTILWTARLIRTHPKPVIGINSGQMGFLANTNFSMINKALTAFSNKSMISERRYFLIAESDKLGTEYALNEFLFIKKDTASMITLKAYYGGELINTYRADGLIISSPTGSTAYSLSSGGPIVHPESNITLLTPINPHTLTSRPLVLPSHKTVKISLEAQYSEVLFSYDGKNQEISGYPIEVHIKQSEYFIDLYELPTHTYFNTLRQKLMWGKDIREV